MSPSKELVLKGPSELAVINPDQTLKASKALLSHIQKAAIETSAASDTRNLLADADGDGGETPIWLTLTTKRHITDKARLQPGKISVPHPLIPLDDEQSTICLITADPQRAYKTLVASDEFPASLGKRITRVIDFGKIKAKYSAYEAQRKLFSEHDIFLGDDRIINRLPKVLGKSFYKNTQKRPIPVILSAKKSKKVNGKKTKPATESGVNAGTSADIAKEIQKALSSALVSLSPSTNTAIKIGWSKWSPEQIAENVEAVTSVLVERWVPQKWRNVRSIYIKGPNTAALPIWLTDELWLEEGDVVADTDERVVKAALKRKKVGSAEDSDKPQKKAKNLPDGNDDDLDKLIAGRKDKLKIAKAKAQKAIAA